MMAAVVLTPAQVEALGQVAFCAPTFHVIQKDGTRTVAEEGLSLGRQSWAASDCSAHHVSVSEVPVIITHGSPHGFVENLYATLTAAVAVPQTDGRFDWRWMNRQVHHSSMGTNLPCKIALKKYSHP